MTLAPYSYTCVRCNSQFGRERRIPDNQEPRCEPCRKEIRKAAKRATWARHGKQYRATTKAARAVPTVEVPRPRPIQPVTIPTPEPTKLKANQPPQLAENPPPPGRAGSLVSFPIRNGKRIVWIAKQT